LNYTNSEEKKSIVVLQTTILQFITTVNGSADNRNTNYKKIQIKEGAGTWQQDAGRSERRPRRR